MALLLLEGFDTTDDISDVYYTAYSTFEVSVTQVRSGTQSLRSAAHTTQYLYIPLDTSVAELYVSFHLYLTAHPTSSNYSFLQFWGGGGYGCFVGIQDDGSLFAGGPSEQDDSGTNVITTGNWHHIEIKVIKSNSCSAGDFTVKVNGVDFLVSEAGGDYLNNGTAVTDMLVFRGFSGSQIYYVDNLVVCDATGSYNNTYTGEVVIATLFPDGNGTTSDFVGSDSNSVDNYLLVDDSIPPDDDTTYVESATPTDIDLYTFGNMPITPTAIMGVQLCCYARHDDSGNRTGKNIARVNGSNYEGDEFFPGPSYLHHHHVWEVNPDDSAAWEEADINSAEFGVKVQS